MIRTYRDLRRLETLEDRFRYLNLTSKIGASTFGFDRWMNQRFYTSREWRSVRDVVIVRDNGCDLGLLDHPIPSRPIIHHMNPMTADDIESGNDAILNPDFLITVAHKTHNAIHFGDSSLLPKPLTPRSAGDTRLW